MRRAAARLSLARLSLAPLLAACLPLAPLDAAAQQGPQFADSRTVDPAASPLKLQARFESGEPTATARRAEDARDGRTRFERHDLELSDAATKIWLRATVAQEPGWRWPDRTPERALRGFAALREVAATPAQSFRESRGGLGFDVQRFEVSGPRKMVCVAFEGADGALALSGVLCDRSGRDVPRAAAAQLIQAVGFGATLTPAATLTVPRAAAGPATRLSTKELRERARAATVLIYRRSGNSVSIGTGFFVTPTLIVTNRHVADQEGEYTVANAAMGKALKANRVAASPNGPPGALDLALLQIEGGYRSPATLPLAAGTAGLNPVIVLGYPGTVTGSDPSFRRFIGGGGGVPPEPRYYSGEVARLQPNRFGVRVINHTAEISQGNSGGPLIDACGALVGINTYGEEKSQTALGGDLYFAQSVEEVARFLDARKVEYRKATVCE